MFWTFQLSAVVKAGLWSFRNPDFQIDKSGISGLTSEEFLHWQVKNFQSLIHWCCAFPDAADQVAAFSGI